LILEGSAGAIGLSVIMSANKISRINEIITNSTRRVVILNVLGRGLLLEVELATG
jgi:hypothetical protein